jgi:hypothetical protein
MFCLGSPLVDADPLWEGAVSRGDVAGLPIFTERLPVLRRAMVVSQGCELIKPNYPWATVVPVWDVSRCLSQSQQTSITASKTWHLVHLTAPWTKTESLWVADLRLEMPLDKTVLAAQEPTEAFANETDYASLADRLAAVRARPAVPQPCIDHVVEPLQTLLNERRVQGIEPLVGVREVRTRSNHHESPTVVTLFVVTDEQAEQPPDADEWQQLFDSLHETAAHHGITMDGPEIGSLWEMTAADYLASQPIDAAASS